MPVVRFAILCFALILMSFTSAFASITIGVVGKTKNDSFYIQSFKGCVEFARQIDGLKCIYDGPDDFQDIRGQTIRINQMIDDGIDALLVSTTDSQYLVEGALKRAYKKNIPVITFDSDLMPEHHDYRLAYIGTNNFDFGVALGDYVKSRFEPQTVCIQSGHPTTPNLNERIKGVRFALSGQRLRKLAGKSGWKEHELCPLYSLGKRDLALNQLVGVLKLPKPPIFIAVAGFAQFNPDYQDQIMIFSEQLSQRKRVIVSADTEQVQLDILEKGLSTANIGQNPFEMGRIGAQYLYQYLSSKRKPKQEFTYLDFHYCTQNNAKTCTVNH